MTTLGDEYNGAKYHNPETNEIFSVEDLSLYYYLTKEGFSGIHSENGLGMTLFGLFFWNQIFDDSVPGVFQTPYQLSPLDYGSKEFYYRREEKIQARLLEISQMSSCEIKEEISHIIDQHYGTHNNAVRWDSVKFSKIKLVDIAA